MYVSSPSLPFSFHPGFRLEWTLNVVPGGYDDGAERSCADAKVFGVLTCKAGKLGGEILPPFSECLIVTRPAFRWHVVV